MLRVPSYIPSVVHFVGLHRLLASRPKLIKLEMEVIPMAEFFDVEGIPVSLGNLPGVEISSAAWDVIPPRVFDPVSARRNGMPESVEDFLASLSPEALAFALPKLQSAGLLSPVA